VAFVPELENGYDLAMLPGLTIALVALLFGVLLAIERFAPLRCARYGWGRGLLRRLVLNLVVSALAYGTALLVVRPATLAALGWSADARFGLAYLVRGPEWAAAGLAFLLMDLSFYYWHLANHRVRFLWRFHNVHHTDPDLDASTAFRFHFGEVAMSAAFRVAQVVIIGVPMGVFVVYELIFQANTLFHHSNVRLPIQLERLLNRLLVTPRMHGIHHSQVRRENNSNFGVVFPWWDWLHRTLRLNIPQSRVAIGIAGYSAPHDNRLWSLIRMPFTRQRDYWRRAGGEPALLERDPAEQEGDPHRLSQ
jgi:sterol desaturase/sphingolipid hydroxylase (fatty acid hydroxylase superfamily)